MKNKLILSLVALFFAFGLNAQVNLQEKRIYVVDVTASMEGRGVISTPDIFSTVKNNLEKTISNISDLSTEVEIITFTNKVLSEYSNTVANKEDIISYVQSLKVCGGDTNIADAWSAGVSKLDPNKINYLFLLTDGLHNCGPDKNVLYERLSDWANFSEGKYMFAFYVMLTPNAHELAICQTVEETQNMWLIESMDIDASLVKVSSVISANVFENNLVDVEIEPNEPINLDEIGFRLDVEKNDYYDVSVYRIDSTKITLAVSEKVDRMSIPLCDTISLGLTHNTSDYPFVFFTPEQLSFIVANQGKRTVKIKEDSFLAFPITEIKIKSKFKEPFRGPFKWGRRIFEPTLDYYPFKWFAPDTTVNTYPVKLDFNDEAIRSSAQISLSFRDENNGILPICSLSSKSTFNALSDNGKQVLEISVDPTIKGGKYTGNIFVSASDIDEVNGEISSSGLYKIGKLTIKEKHPWPMLLWTLWLLIAALLLYLLVWLGKLLIYALTSLHSSFSLPVTSWGRGMHIESGNSRITSSERTTGLTEKDKAYIRKKTGWSNNILDYIGSIDEAKIYMKANLKEALVDGRPALIRQDIDWAAFNCRKEWLKNKLSDWQRWKDYNNADLIGEGYPPRDVNGDPYELHHIGQKQGSPYAELTWEEHMGNGNNTILHKAGKESEIDRGLFDNEKSNYWQARYKLFTKKELYEIYHR